MQTIQIKILKEDAWEEAAKVAAYTGDKLTDADEGAYERTLLTEADRQTFGRFWEEASATAIERLKEFTEKRSEPADDLELTLKMARNYDTGLNESVASELRSFMVAAIAGRWMRLCCKAEAEGYLAEAQAHMEKALTMLYSRKRPRRQAFV